MRIGFLLPSIFMYHKFGQGRIFAPGELARRLVDLLVQKGHEVYFYTAPDTATSAKLVEGDRNLLESNLSYFLIRNRSAAEQEFTVTEVRKRDYEYHLTMKAYKDALSGKLDIIHSYHDFGAHYFNELTGFPTVYTLHDPMPAKDTVERFRLEKFKHHNYISISNHQRTGMDLNFSETIYHGVELDEFGFGKGGEDYAVFFGRILEDKGPDIAIEAAKRAGIQLRIASSYQKDNISKEYYEGKIKPHEDGMHVLEVGFLQGKEKSDYVGNAKAFVFPLHWEEPFGMVMIESMACGTPVVAFARGSSTELIRDGVTGYLVNSSDTDIRGDWVTKKTGTDGLVEALERIKSMGSDDYSNMRHNCRKLVEENFTLEKTAQKHEELYQKLIKK